LAEATPARGCGDQKNTRAFLLHKIRGEEMRKLTISLCACLLLLLPPPAFASAGSLKKASFIPQWVPQAQFAGYYVALEKGIYKRHGIELTILSGGPHNPSLDLLKDGKANFATLWLSSGIQARSQGIRLVNIGQMVQRSALMLVAKKSSGIRSPQDLNGRKVGLWGPVFQVQPRAFFKQYNLEVNVVPQSYSVNLFLRGGVDAASAMLYNEYHTLYSAGIDFDELTAFRFHDHGLNFPEDGIYVMETLLRRDPELCRAFVKASIEGWEQAFLHPQETLDMVMKNLKREYIPATRVHQKWMLERMKDLMVSDDGKMPMGALLPEDYDRVAVGLHTNGLIGRIPDLATFYRKYSAHDAK
jgi:NitT/TauT family transport system substrate-binding protein